MSVDRFQKREVSWQEVIDRIDVGNKDKVSKLIVSISPCRSGSTALLRVFGASSINSHYQEVKNILRWRMQNQEISWLIPQEPEKSIYLKETLGPYTKAESSINILDILIKAGYPPEKLRLIIYGRAVLSTWTSWLQYWGDKTTLENMILSYKTTEKSRLQAVDMGISTTVIVYESLRDNSPEKIINSLMLAVGELFVENSINGWTQLPPFGAPGSHIHIPDEPEEYFADGTRDRVKMSDSLSFFSRKDQIAGLLEEDVKLLIDQRIPEIYETWKNEMVDCLNLNIQADNEFDLVNTK